MRVVRRPHADVRTFRGTFGEPSGNVTAEAGETVSIAPSRLGRPVGANAEQTRQRIVAATMRCVAEVGYSGATIREIAPKVADSFAANWTFAQEFTFDYETYLKRRVFTVVKTDPPMTDPDLARPRTPRPKPNS